MKIHNQRNREGTRYVTDNLILKDAVRDFKRSVEITRDVRFQANLRLAARQRTSAYIVSFLSLYVIALSLIPNILDLKPVQSQVLLACSIVLSVFIIFTSLIDSAQNFYHRGELLHQCARKIANIHHSLKNIDIDLDPDKAHKAFEALQGEYAKALDECPVNHENVDFYFEMVRKPHLFPADYPARWKMLLQLWFRIKAWILQWLWLVPHTSAFLVISVIVYVLVMRGSAPAGTSH